MKKLITILTILIITLTAISAFAQMPIPIGPGDGDGVTTPIGGLAILAALGGGYAIKKLRGRKQ